MTSSQPATTDINTAALRQRISVLLDGELRRHVAPSVIRRATGMVYVALDEASAGLIDPPDERVDLGETEALARLLVAAHAHVGGRHRFGWDTIDDEARGVWLVQAEHVLRSGRVHVDTSAGAAGGS